MTERDGEVWTMEKVAETFTGVWNIKNRMMCGRGRRVLNKLMHNETSPFTMFPFSGNNIKFSGRTDAIFQMINTEFDMGG